MSEVDYTIVVNDNYVALPYEPPVGFARIGKFVENMVVGKDIETPNSILAFVSGDRIEQVEYIEGLVGIGVFLAVLVSLWFLTLLLLKYQGRERMGCSAGYAFHDSESDDRAVIEERKKRGGASGTLFQGDGQDVSVGAAVDPDDSVAMDEPALREIRKKKSLESSSKRASKVSSIFARKKKELSSGNYITPETYLYDSQNLQELELHLELDNIVQSSVREKESRQKEEEKKDHVWSLYSVPKTVRLGDESSMDESTVNSKHPSSEKVWGETWLCSAHPDDVERRKFQTRSVFALFAMVSLICCALLVTHMYKPLESAALASGSIIQETAQIVDELNGVLEILDEATAATVEMVETTPLDYNVLCPDYSIQNFQLQFGYNPQNLIQTTSSTYQNYVPTIVDLLNTAKETGDSVTNMLLDIDESVSTTNEYLWIVPLVICITMLIIFSQLALMIAVVYREQKFKDIRTTVPQVENCYGWTILPLQTFVVFLSWLLVIAFCFGIVITTDSCMPSFGGSGDNGGRGTPDDVILAVVDQYIVTTNTGVAESLAKERLATYVTGCGGMESDPLAEVIVLQGLLQESIAEVDTQLSIASDDSGLQFLERQCGPGNQVKTFFRNLTLLNSKYANVNMAIKQGYDALSCPRVNSLYVDAVHGAFCTDFATANANGLILLIIISFSGMILITLRASWRSAE